MTDGTKLRHKFAPDPGWQARRYTGDFFWLYADPNNGNNCASFGPTGRTGLVRFGWRWR